MKNQKILVTFILAILVFIGIMIFNLSKNGSDKMPVFGGSVNYPAVNAVSSTTSRLVTTASTLIQASTTRQYLAIVNDGTYPIYITCNGGNAAVAYEGIRLNGGGGSYEMTFEDGNMCFGAIYGIAVGGNSSTTLTSISQQ